MSRLKERLLAFCKSIWFFPVILFAVVIILSALQISGSSIGTYHDVFYGDSSHDPNLLANKPRGIRSDEWLVTSQLNLAQVKNNFNDVNKNIGNGEDVSVLVDAPNTSFIQIFKPQSFGYFFLPAGIAFALKWWLPIYLLIMSVYFFILTLMPKRKLIAVLASLCFAASPFVVWWGQYSTIYTALFMMIIVIKMLKSKSVKHGLVWGFLLAYLTTSFIVILYPPFQIACALASIGFLVGYYFDNKPKTWKDHRPLVCGGVFAIGLTVALTALSLAPKLPIIETTASTAYPGARMTTSGTFNPLFFAANNSSFLTQKDQLADNFGWLANQSEGSNFLLVFLLLVPVVIYFIVRYRRKLDNFYTIIGIFTVGLVFLAWMFVPDIEWLGNITLLNRVPQARLLIGFGMINLFILIIFLQIYDKKNIKLPKHTALLYSLVILTGYLLLDFHIHNIFPLFMSAKWAILLALPYPVIIYFLLTKRHTLALSALLVFSIGSVCFIHPLYRGIDVLTESELSKSIRSIDPDNSKRWATDILILENFPVMNGKKSLSGTYVYPQNDLWEKSFPNNRNMYNRYAHVHFVFDRDIDTNIRPRLSQPQADVLVLTIEPCDPFLKENSVRYILTATPFTQKNASCANLEKKITYPKVTLYTYSLHF